MITFPRHLSGRFTVGLLALLAALLVVPLAHAANKSKPKPDAPAPPEDTRILVTAVDLAQSQVTITHEVSKQKQTYTIDDLTTVTVSGHPGTVKDIKVGQQVSAYEERRADTLDSIEVGIADPAPVVPGKKK